MPRRPALPLFALVFALALAAAPARAASIVNGNFATGDLTGWSLDTDGAGPPDLTLYSDFGVEAVGGGNVARIEADYFETPGDWLSTPFNQVWFANTLYQGLDLSAGPGLDLYLSFEWELGGEAAVTDEVFLVGLNDGSGSLYGADGTLGLLLEATAYGSGSFSALLDYATFANASGWSLDFQLGLTGFDAYGSYARIGNVTLEARGGTEPPVAPIPEPGTLLLLGSGLAALVGVRRRQS
ncbi:MAG: PEP-CTERM sorting domain-containing protein [Thermodesulfobacteriota bacterium]|jgi:hypothetical protein